MPHAIIKPEEVRKFASELKRFNEELKNNFIRIHGRFKQLGETWRDQEYKRFEKEFDQTGKSIRQFLTASEKYIPYLDKKVRPVEEYLNIRR